MAPPLSKFGIWVWDSSANGVVLQSRDCIQPMESATNSDVSSVRVSFAGKAFDNEILTADHIDLYKQAKFRKHYQRQVRHTDVPVTTIQDIKDVALFTANVDDLYPEFINYFHTSSMDRFLRSTIVYFQYYLQVWEKIQLRRKEAVRKLRQPIVTELENEVRDNLADLRSMVSRDYAAILTGIGDAKTFHHMNNKNNISMADKDRRLFELFIFMTTKVVWIALFRRGLSLIEKEVNRLLRTQNYSPIEHSIKSFTYPTASKEEQRVVLGKAYKKEKKLLSRSPVIQEIVRDDHDYRLLSIGINRIPEADDRIRYLEIALAAPEELLVDEGIAVGVLGVERRFLDPMIKPLDISTTVKKRSVMKIGEFKMPPRSIKRHVTRSTLPNTPCKYKESQNTMISRVQQCKKWKEYLENGGTLKSETEDPTSIRGLVSD